MYFRWIPEFLTLTFFISSCVVMEDRTACPQPLKVVPGRGAVDVSVRYRVSVEDETIWYGLFECPADSSLSIDVPRTILSCFGSRSEMDYYDEEGNFVIPQGCESPEYWTHHAVIDASIPVISDTVVMHRSCALLSFHVSGSGVGRSCDMSVQGNCNGFANDGSPGIGSFEKKAFVVADKSGEMRWQLRVPRQWDDALTLEMESAGAYRLFPIGQYLTAAGYDWEADDLEDVEIDIDYQGSYMRIGTRAWEKTLSFEIIF